MPTINIKTVDASFKYEVVAQIISVNAEPVQLLFTPTSVTCPTCGGDDPFCVTCAGAGVVLTHITRDVQAIVLWKASDRRVFSPRGQYFEGDVQVLVIYANDTVPESAAYSNVYVTEEELHSLEYIIVDSKRVYVDYHVKEGHPYSRVRFVCRQSDQQNNKDNLL